MTKPHEETWEASEAEDLNGLIWLLQNVSNGEEPFGEVWSKTSCTPDPRTNAARAKLAAQAPAMARLLLKYHEGSDFHAQATDVLRAAGVLE